MSDWQSDDFVERQYKEIDNDWRQRIQEFKHRMENSVLIVELGIARVKVVTLDIIHQEIEELLRKP